MTAPANDGRPFAAQGAHDAAASDPRRSNQSGRLSLLILAATALLGVMLFLPFISATLGTLTSPEHQRGPGQANLGSGRDARAATTAPKQPATRPQAESPHVKRDEEGRLQWPRPRSTERQRERDAMVDTQIARASPFSDPVRDGSVLAAMRAVPRHEFVPPERRNIAYIDSPLPIGHGQTISQPYIVALMTELLEVKPGDRVLEIGTGSGYQAAVLAWLTPYVYSIEVVEPLCKQGAQRLDRLGYKTVEVRCADGYDGWPEQAPFDGIIVTCAAGHVPPPLWEQLKPGGRMVVPIGGTYDTQRLVVLTKRADGTRQSRNVLPVRFVPMTGKIERE